MSEHPIIFSGAMVRAILDGRKTQTRRVVKPQPFLSTINPPSFEDKKVGEVFICPDLFDPKTSVFVEYEGGGRYHNMGSDVFSMKHCPYGHPGDHLWVRETCRAEELQSGLDGVRYLADDEFLPIENTEDAAERWLDLRWYGKRASPVSPVKTVPAIHMPRWASRITLEITGIRVERLQVISSEDAIAEGVNPLDGSDGPNYWTVDTGDNVHLNNQTAQGAYSMLWDWIKGPCSWDTNPFVWVIEFKTEIKK